MIDWLIDWLRIPSIDWSIDWLIDWLIDRLALTNEVGLLIINILIFSITYGYLFYFILSDFI